MAGPVQSRRARLRAEATQEIKEIALRHMAANGSAAVSLRAIAREMGMTAGAIYSYYDTRDALITALIADVYNALSDFLEAAIDAAPQDALGRLVAYSNAYRDWGIANQEKFRLIYGDPIPDYQLPAGGPAAEAEHRACTILTGVVAAAWPQARRLHGTEDHSWSDYDPDFAELVRGSFPDLPPAAVALALRVWGRLHGLICLEVYGHLRPQVRDPQRLYRAEVAELASFLGLAAYDG